MYQLLSTLTIRQRLYAGFGLIILLTIFLAGLTAYNSNVESQAVDALRDAEEEFFLTQRIESDMLQARRREKDFLLRWRADEYEAAFEEYVQANREHIATALAGIRELRDLQDQDDPVDARHIEELTQIEQYVLTYQVSLEQVFSNIALLDSETGKLEPNLYAAMESLDRIARHTLNDFDLLHEITLGRIVIGDYVLSPTDENAALFRAQIGLASERIQALNLFVTQQRDLDALLQNALTLFDGLAEINREIATETELFRGAIQNAETVIAVIVADELAAAEEAQKKFQDAKNSSRQQNIAGVGVISILLLFTAASVSGSITRPLDALTHIAARFGRGDLTARAETSGRDEISALGGTLNNMAGEIQGLVSGLESRVSERTADLSATVDVGRLATSIYDQETLLPELVEYIHSRFDLYYAQIYLLDEAKRYAVLRAGSGEVGQQLLERGHRLNLGETSIVARTVQGGDPVLVVDTETSAIHKPNPLLPDTRSEVAIPLVAGNEIIGVLDMQASRAGTFNEENLTVFQAMAGQIAAAIRGTQAYAQAQEAIAQAERINRRLTAERWQPYLSQIGEGGRLGYEYDLESPKPLQTPITSYLDATESDGLHIAQPIKLRGLQIGTILVEENTEHHWSDEEIALVTSISERIAQAVEQYRAFDETHRRALEMETVSQVSAEASTTLDVDTLLWNVSNLVKERFDLYHAHIYLLDDTGQTLVLTAGAGAAGLQMVAEKRSIPMARVDSLVATAARTREGVIVNDVTANPNFLPHPMLPDTRSELAVPMVIGSTLIGVLDVQDGKIGRFTDNDVQIQTTLASQIAVAVQNARAFESVREAEAIAREALRKAEDVQFALDQHSIVAITNVRGEILYVNDKFMEISKYSEEELIGQDHRILNSGYHPKEFMRELWTTIANGKVYHNEIRNRAKDGSLYWVDTTIVPFMNEQNKPYQYVAIRTDITERKAQEAQILRRAAEMETVSRVSVEASQSLEADALLWDVTALVKEQFDLYHAHIYLLDDAGQNLVLTAGAGEVGRQMVAEHRTIPYNRLDSLVATAARTREGVIVNDVTANPNFLPHPLLPHTKAELAVPMIVGNTLIGVLDVQADQVDYFTDSDVQVQTTLAAQVAVAVQNARAFEQVQKQSRQLALVSEVSARASTILDPDELITQAAQMTADAFDLYHIHIYTLDETGTKLLFAAGTGRAPCQHIGKGYSLDLNQDKNPVTQAARTFRGVIDNDLDPDLNAEFNPFLPETRSQIAIPMVVGNRLIGVLEAHSTVLNGFDEDDMLIQTTLAAQIASAVQNARLFAETERQAERERETADRLREVDRLKSQFLANMSHELRTPLNSIIGYSEVLIDGVDGDLTDDAMEDVEAIHNSGKHLLSIINEILDLAKIEANEMQLDIRPVSYEDVVNEIIRSSQPLVKDKSVKLEMVKDVDDFPLLSGDVVRLRQITLNLVSNAIKFTEEGSVKVHLGRQDDDMALIRVADTGVGMKPEDLPVIFERFSQVDGSSTRRAGGTGLGLTITKQLIEMHGGEVEVTSEYGKGTIFAFTLPFAKLQE